MPIDLPGDDTTQGPLDVAKAAGYEEGQKGTPTLVHGGDGGEILDARPAAQDPTRNSADYTRSSVTTEPQNETELMERKNPLGYSVTPATEEEIDAADEPLVDDLQPASRV